MSHSPDSAVLHTVFPLVLGACREDVPPDATHCLVDLESDGALPCALAAGVRPRKGQRVLVARPENGPPVLLAVLAGSPDRAALAGGYSLECEGAPASRVLLRAQSGAALLGIEITPDGVTLTLPPGATRLSADGALELEGDSVTLKARRTDVRVEANDDVVLRGERVRLN